MDSIGLVDNKKRRSIGQITITINNVRYKVLCLIIKYDKIDFCWYQVKAFINKKPVKILLDIVLSYSADLWSQGFTHPIHDQIENTGKKIIMIIAIFKRAIRRRIYKKIIPILISTFNIKNIPLEIQQIIIHKYFEIDNKWRNVHSRRSIKGNNNIF